ncbi:neurogenic locus Notch protein-like isoform X38 [Patiria miniata]|uniref:EGF-like domain-containing protein n=1 Tax=Patiria miniata TaxID=46514 RepID=A0A914APR6_PATMI|nr:neurogenic locus Notch protein-like isoform X38 [Patiria miniata]
MVGLFLLTLAVCHGVSAYTIQEPDTKHDELLYRDLELLDQILKKVNIDDTDEPRKMDLVGTPVKQSSTNNAAGLPEGAIDGNRNSNYNGRSCSSTKFQRNPFWQVDLQTEHCISKVTVLNRGDCCQSRLQGVLVRAGPSSIVSKNPACGIRVTKQEAAVAGDTIVRECERPLRARYITLGILSRKAIITVCEVEAYELPMLYCIDECESDPCQNGATCEDGLGEFSCICESGFTGALCETISFAGETELNIVGNDAGQSSVTKDADIRQPGKPNDGKFTESSLIGEDGTISSGSCTITEPERNPYWVVMLDQNEEEHCISHVSILNRGDGDSQLLTGAVVRVGSVSPRGDISDNSLCGLPVTAEQASVPGGTIYFECDPPVNGMFLFVTIPSQQATLQLCEVRVWEMSMDQCIRDTDPCDSDPCQNGATCVKDADAFSCTCAAGFTGPLCETVSFEGETELNIVGNEAGPSSYGDDLNYRSDSKKANDGKFTDSSLMGGDGTISSGSCLITEPQRNPMWGVKLDPNGEEQHCISHVSILNRGDGDSQLLTGAVVRVGSAHPPYGDFSDNSLCGLPVTAEQASVPGGTIYFECDPPANGMFLFVIIPSEQATLQLCEVRVWEMSMDQCIRDTDPCDSDPCQNGAACVKDADAFSCTCAAGFTGPLCETVNFEGETELNIVGNEAGQSSYAEDSNFNSDYKKANDGKFADSSLMGGDGTISSGSCIVTAPERNPFWGVRLDQNEEEHCISHVSILNRGDGDSELLTGAVVRVGSVHPPYADISDNSLCGLPVTAEQASVPGGTIYFECDPPVNGLLLFVTIPSEQATLQLCEVRVWETSMDQCIRDTDPCDSDPCQNGATCVKGADAFSCTCAAGFTGPLCETVSFAGETELNIVGNDAGQSSATKGSTVRQPGKPNDGKFTESSLIGEDGTISSGSCTITELERNPFWGVTLDPNEEEHCISHVSILNRGDGDSELLTGAVVRVGHFHPGIGDISDNSLCGLPVTAEQASVPGGTVYFECDPPVNGMFLFVTIPSEQATLQLCEVRVWEKSMDQCIRDTDPCDSDPCQNGATCVKDADAFSCTCAAGFTGPLCETVYFEGEAELNIVGNNGGQSSNVRLKDSNGYSDFRKANDGKFTDSSLMEGESGGSCTITEPERNPYWGVRLDPNDEEQHCISHVSILNRGDGDSELLTGAVVRVGHFHPGIGDISDNSLCGLPVTAEQASVPGGTIYFECDPPVNGMFLFVTIPSEQATLQLCEVRVWEMSMDQCIRDTDPCDSDPCQNGATCVKDADAFSCTCAAGFTGPLCETDIDECASEPCHNGATCQDGINEVSCTCADGFTGGLCETNIDDCASDPCENGATCADGINEVSCTCAKGFTGALCETNIDECASDPCHNGATCADGINEVSCTCVEGFIGALCETNIDECASDPCQNGATCQDGINEVSCTCVEGFTGSLCETDIDDCASDPCHNGATCQDGIHEVSCTCADGFTGGLCETNIDDCASDPCENGATCADGINEVTCTCAKGFTGALCETNIDECASDPCRHGATCQDGINKVSCTCVEGFTGPLCETDIHECSSDPCQNGATCVDGINEVTCTCAAGFTGGLCETNIDDCVSDPCQNGATCQDGVNEVACTCAEGFTGDFCETNIDECASDPCHNGATCADGINEVSCTCVEGFTGPLCETDIHECSSDPCQNGATCVDGINQVTCTCAAGFTGGLCETNIDDCVSDPCQNGATCQDGVNEVACTCAEGFTGDFCETNFDECASDPCLNGATCEDGVNEVSCTCVEGFTGPLCETDIDECSSDPCQNGATCVDGINEVTCTCAAGFTGGLCETNIDDCVSDPCQNGATCQDGVNEVACTCAEGFTGDFCETNFDDCASEPCLNGATCEDGVNEVSCTCAEGFTGPLCETDIHECSSDPCQNGATCVDGINTVTCSCAAGFTGSLCETDIDECGSSPCQNGVCHDEVDGFRCECSPGYEGTFCETSIDECASDPCLNGATCADGINEVTCTCAEGFTGPLCETDIDECASIPCLNGATCEDGTNEVSCTCAEGFAGPRCETVLPKNQCDSDPCMNDGICIPEADSFSCDCAQGFQGNTCDINIDECASNPCQNGGTCVDGINKVSCTCAEGYTGVLCQIAVSQTKESACDSSPCQNGVCLDEEDGFSCECSSGYEGDLCETKSNGCIENPCKNGICIKDGLGGSRCICSPGYEGVACEINTDECASDPCQNGAACVDGVNQVSCECLEGFFGPLCESSSPVKLETPMVPVGPEISEVNAETSLLQVNLITAYCIKKVVVKKRGDCTSDRLTGAVVRAGTSSTGLNNGMCGSALTAQQAEVRRSTVDFVCDPPLTAQFVTVDIPLLRVTQQQMCEVTVEQAIPGPC